MRSAVARTMRKRVPVRGDGDEPPWPIEGPERKVSALIYVNDWAGG